MVAPYCPVMARSGLAIAYAALCALAAGCFYSERKTQDVNVLFIGNSYTFQHNVPSMVEKTRRVEDDIRIRYRTALVADGGRNLIAYVGDRRVVRLLQDHDWDFIVLQDRSTAAFYAREREEFDRAVRWFQGAAQQKRAELVLFQTWPRKSGHAFYAEKAEYGFTPPRSQEEMARRLASVYRRAAETYDGVVAPVGRCWMQAENRDSLYAEDGSHASRTGARLAATVIENTLKKAADPCEFAS